KLVTGVQTCALPILATGSYLPTPELSEKWNVIIGHCRTHAENWGDEEKAIRAMRARLMAYSRNFPEAKALREKFQRVATLADVRSEERREGKRVDSV